MIIALDTEQHLLDLGVERVDLAGSNAAAFALLDDAIPDFAVLDFNLGDEASEPVIGARVVASRREFVEGEWQYFEAGGDTSDDRGAYRIFGLVPGEYIVSTPTMQATLPGGGRV